MSEVAVLIEAEFGRLPDAKKIIGSFYPKVKVAFEGPSAVTVVGKEEDIVLMLFALKPYSIDHGAPISCSYDDVPPASTCPRCGCVAYLYDASGVYHCTNEWCVASKFVGDCGACESAGQPVNSGCQVTNCALKAKSHGGC